MPVTELALSAHLSQTLLASSPAYADESCHALGFYARLSTICEHCDVC